jgi:D-alanyl-lipoteichoic acid acyltransferase DltB (MBOAT superfamily)
MSLQGRPLVVASWSIAAGALACPLLIPAADIGLRAASAFLSVDIAFKIVDFAQTHRGTWNGAVVHDYFRFLIPFPALAIVFPDHKRRLKQRDALWPHILRIVIGTAFVAVALLLTRAVSENVTVRSCPVLSHVLRVLIFVPTIEAISRVLYGLERLAGFDTRPIIRNAFLSRTVAEFWQRYNGRVHDWFDRNVFRPLGGRRAPVRGVLIVFFVSAVHHEVMFDLATSQITGYQFAFFMLQAPAVLASGRLERWVRRGGLARKVAAHASTILFLSATSVLFFDGVSKVFPQILTNGSPLP